MSAIHGKNIPIYGDGQQIRDWSFVDDHVKGLVLAFVKGQHGQTYNIGASNEIKNIDIVIKICELLEELVDDKPEGVKKFTDLIVYVKDRPGHDRRSTINSSKIQNNLGWKVEESFESGLRKPVQWYLENKPWCPFIMQQSDTLKIIGSD